MGLSILTKILVNVFRSCGLCHCVPKTSPRENWPLETGMEKCNKSVPTHQEEQHPQELCFGQICPEGMIISKWIKSCRMGWTEMQDRDFFAIPERFRALGSHFYSDQQTDGLVLPGWFGSSKRQGVLREIRFISTTCPSTFYYSCFAAVQEF